MLNIIKNTINRVFASGVDSDASAFITATGLSGTTQKSAITTLVKDLKASGLWSKMKAVYPMITDNYNLLSYTENFTNAAWSNDQASASANQTTAPDGTLTADKLIENSANNHHLNYQSVGATVGQLYTFSVYLKAAERQYASIQVADSNSPVNRYTVLIDLNNGVILNTRSYNSPTNTSNSITSIGNGWYRVSVTMTQVGGSLFYGHIATSNSATPSYDSIDFPTYLGNGTSGIYIWGGQIQLGSTASTYQPILTTPAAFMASQMKYNLKDARDLDAAFRLTWSGGWTYSATGATPNGTNAYADTKLNLFNNLTANSYHSSLYLRTPLSKVQSGYGAIKADFTERADIINYTGTLYSTVGNGTTQVGTTVTPYQSLIVGSRYSSTSNSLYVGGVLRGNSTVANSTNLPAFNYYLGTVNQNMNFYSDAQLSFSTIGTGLSDQDSQLLNQIVEKYQVALSRGVQAAQSFYYNSAYSNEANTYLYSTQITGTTQVSAINTLINGLKANNLWAKMKAVYPFVTDYRNLLGYTEDFSNAYWTKTNANVSLNASTAPNGTNTANSIIPTTNNAFHLVTSPYSLTTTSNTVVYSGYFKPNGYNYVSILIPNNGGLSKYFEGIFNISTGNIESTSRASTYTGTRSIVSVGNGWYRCSITITNADLNSTHGAWIVPMSTNDPSVGYPGNGTSGIYAWGAQFELGSTASVYQPVLGVNNYSTNVAAQMKFNLVNPQDSDAAFRLAFSGGWTYSTNGAQPNGTNGYADTKFNLSSNFSTREQSYSLYTQASNSNANVLAGVTDGSSPTQFYNGTGQFNILSTLYAKGSSFSNGCILMTSTLSAISAFEKAIKIGTTSGSTYSAVNYNYYIGARNSAGASDFFADRRYSFAHIGNSLTDTEATLLSQLIQQYQTDLSRQV